MHDTRHDLVIARFVQRTDNRFHRPLHIALDQQGEFLASGGFELAHHIGQRSPRGPGPCCGAFTLLALTIGGNFTRPCFVFNNCHAVACFGCTAETENFNRHGRTGFFQSHGIFRKQRAHAAPFRTGNNDVTRMQRPTLHQNRCHRATTAIKLGFNHSPFGHTIGIGFQIENFCLQGNHLEQFIESATLFCRDLDFERITAHRLDLHFILQQFRTNEFGIGAWLVDLVDSHNHRHFCSLGMIDGFNRLRHDAIIGSHN